MGKKVPHENGGDATWSQVINNAERWLGDDSRQSDDNKSQVSADGTRAIRMGDHETKTDTPHVHFEVRAEDGVTVIADNRVNITSYD